MSVIIWVADRMQELGGDRLQEKNFRMYHFRAQGTRPKTVISPIRGTRTNRDDLGEVKWMKDQREQINPDDLTFVTMGDDDIHPVENGSFTGFKPGQKLLHLTEFGGRPHMRIVTFEKEAIIGGAVGLVVYVKEHMCYLEPSDLFTIESIQDMFNNYTEEDARRWRAIDDGIIPPVLLSNEEIDKIIDDNEEWCKAYEEVNKNDPPAKEPEKGVWMGDGSIVGCGDDPDRCCMTDCFGYRCEKRTGHEGKHNVGNPKDPFYNPADDPEKEPKGKVE